MARKQVTYKIKGMSQDNAKSLHTSEFSFENKNIRITTRESNSLMSIQNEKGTSKYTLTQNIEGTPIGHAILNDTIILFTHTVTGDYIYKITNINKITKTGTLTMLYQGNLNFSYDAPIQTLVSYENEAIQKVYWIDKNNPPRVINISETTYLNADKFNFVSSLELKENITITKQNGGGEFVAGTIQYAFTYYNKFGQESNIFYMSSLYYNSNYNRGGSPGEIVNNSFNITIENIDTNFDFLRIYSITRTSIDATPILKRVVDIDTSNIFTNKSFTLINNHYFQGTETSISNINAVITSNIDLSDFGVSVGPFSIFNDNYYSDVKFYKIDVDNNRTLLDVDNTQNGKLLLHGTNTEATFAPNEGVLMYNEDNAAIYSLYYNNYIESQDLQHLGIFIKNIGQATITCNYNNINPLNVYSLLFNGVVDLTTLSFYRIELTYDEIITNIGNSCDIAFTEINTGTLPNKVQTSFYKNGIQITDLSGITLAKNESLILEGFINITNTKGTNIITSFGRVAIINNDFDEITTTLSPNHLILNGDVAPGISMSINEFSLNISNVTKYLDTNKTGEIESPTKLLYVGGEDITVGTFAQKHNTLFLGDLTIKKELISNLELGNYTLEFQKKELYQENSQGILYGYTPNTLSKINQKTFKYKERYRFGIQAQHKTGRWSDVLYITDLTNNISPSTIFNLNKVIVSGSKALLTLQSSFIQQLSALNYKKIRGVIVYPEANERLVIAQGIINPTLINPVEKKNKETDNIASWFFRPMIKTAPNTLIYDSEFNPLVNSYTAFKHNTAIPGFRNARNNASDRRVPINMEVQCLRGIPETARFQYTSSYNNDDQYYIDQSVLTLNSPDIEFDETIKQYDGDNFKFRIIGYSNITGHSQQQDATISNTLSTENGKFYNYYLSTDNYSNMGANVLPAWVNYQDDFMGDEGRSIFKFAVFPWHRNGSVNNDIPRDGRTAVLKHKTFGIFRYSGYNTYFNTEWIPNNGITSVGIHNTDSTITKIETPLLETNSYFTYKGNYDKLISTDNDSLSQTNPGFPIVVLHDNSIKAVSDDILPGTADTKWKVSTDLVRIKYKSTPHAVFGLKWLSNTNQIVIPSINTEGKDVSTGPLFYLDNTNNITTTQSTFSDLNYTLPYVNGILYIGELYRDQLSDMFGGNTPQAYEQNTWLPCGEPINIYDEQGDLKTEVTVEYSEGDTFLQRYDCIKTYSEDYTQPNSVTDTLSFLVETRVNLDGRYDKNRSTSKYDIINPDNYNKLNLVYNQKNNYFNYKVLDYDRFYINRFPNTITWTKSKISGALIDAWTNINMINTKDVSGEFGTITKIVLFNDQLIGFQNKALFNIAYNNRVQINTNDGVPIEMASSGTVDSINYISTIIGAQNKHSIVESPAGIYFIDNNFADINVYNGNIQSISDMFGMKSWMSQNNIYNEVFDITNLNNFVTYYNPIDKEVYFINKNTALCYSEILQSFTSFYDYNDLYSIFSLNGATFSFSKDRTENTTYYLWRHFDGDYNKFFNVNKSFYINYLINPDSLEDKVFDTFELRADEFNINNELLPNKPISSIQAYTEYQNAIEEVNDINFKQKFRVWRGLIPRTTSIQNNIFLNPNRLNNVDRIRNTWMNLKLTKDNPSNNKITIQDISLYYTIQ